MAGLLTTKGSSSGLTNQGATIRKSLTILTQLDETRGFLSCFVFFYNPGRGGKKEKFLLKMTFSDVLELFEIIISSVKA